MTPRAWHPIEDRPDVQAYLAAFHACLAAGGSDAPGFVTALREFALSELEGADR